MSVKFTAKVNVDTGLLERKVIAAADKAQAWLDINIAKDTDPYVPFDKGKLSLSATEHRYAPVGSGEIVYWAGNKEADKGYAKLQYYNFPRKRRRGQMRWFEASKKVNLERWVRMARQKFAQGWEEK